MDKRIPDAAIRRVWLDQSLTSAEAAVQVGLSRVRLWVRAKRLGLPARPGGRREVIPPSELRVLWAANVRVAQIAALYGCPSNSVCQASRRLGLAPRPNGRHSTISLAEFRLQLIRRANVAGDHLTEAERQIIQKARSQ